MNNKIPRKLRKLLRDPRLFFSDIYLKRTARKPVRTPPWQKVYSTRKFTVVSAVYNVDRYLEDFFVSLENQVLDFKTSILIVMIDDGSTDGSAGTILKWQEQYPENIKYIYKGNGGQASARNFGLKEVETEWVTFIDPDDFIDKKYFSKLDSFLDKHGDHNIGMLSCNYIYYFEDQDQFKDSHPLRFRFANGDEFVAARNMGKHLQLSVNSAFFRHSIIQANALKFDECIRPNFEDAHFVGRYLRHAAHTEVAFLSGVRYYYRKRSDGTSSLDTGWQQASLFSEVLEFGCLSLVKQYTDLGERVPVFVQRTILYHLQWYFNRIVDRPEQVAFLSREQQARFLRLLDVLFDAIDVDTIIDFELAGCWFFHKVGMLGAFKGTKLPFHITYIEQFDADKRQILIRCMTTTPAIERFFVGGAAAFPVHSKMVEHTFFDRTFFYEKWVWFPLRESGQASDLVTVMIEGQSACVMLAGKQHYKGVTVAAIENAYRPKATTSAWREFDCCWLLMDRNTQADDNGEHLYRYILREHPEIPAYFVLNEDSHDWPRLKTEGFRLIAFGSEAHQEAMSGCSKLISSHADKYIVDPFEDARVAERKFIFLQHGVTKDDLSQWLNTKVRIDLFVTSSPLEQASIVDDGTKYKYSKKETRLLGFPRHDRLLSMQNKNPRTLLVMPTWRSGLLGSKISGNKRELNPEFMTSAYAQSWENLLCDPRLAELSEKYGVQIVFFTHANVQPYLNQFDLPESIEVRQHSEGSIQELFRQCAILLTDYSSVAFEVGYLGRQSIYFQFDEDEIFTGSHFYQKGYFDYRRDGFGPVHLDKDGVLASLEELLERDCKPLPEYKERMENFFAFRDEKCCERVFEAICDLDRPSPPDGTNMQLMKDQAEMASSVGDWSLSEMRWTRFIDLAKPNTPPEDVEHATAKLQEAKQNRKIYAKKGGDLKAGKIGRQPGNPPEEC